MSRAIQKAACRADDNRQSLCCRQVEPDIAQYLDVLNRGVQHRYRSVVAT